MPLTSSEQFRFLRGGGYFVAFATIITQLIDLVLRSWPLSFNSAGWRMSLVGSTAGVGFSLMIMVFLALVIANYMGDAKVALTLCALSISAAVVYLLLSGLFALDFLQMRNQVRMSMTRQYDMTSAWVLIRQLLAVAGFSLIAVGALRGLRAKQRQTAQRQPRVNDLLVGTTRTQAVTPGDGVVEVKRADRISR